ncbi:hypothetical protein [Nocardia wallacei]|uniref:hypothetical protein n=1 Tax=Nocardia wallacei TaxID=480035 RepID=UPI002458AF79|nr:hypothetical protein [Nocardia wallacei]
MTGESIGSAFEPLVAASPSSVSRNHEGWAVVCAGIREAVQSIVAAGNYEYKSEFARRYYDQGLARGEAHGGAKVLLKFLRHRFTVPDSVAERVMTCTDMEQLDIWTDRALDAATLDEVFES